ncbi:MAG: tryptophanase [Chloroflexota bacterium]|nr:MAG: tryptophanase [Chloroflexota bacterium]
MKPIPEPFRIKMVEALRPSTREERVRWLEEAGYNLFNLRAAQVYIDLLTDSGTGAMSDRQWSAMLRGDESYAGAESFYRLAEAVEEVFGFTQFVPTHQGRAAEALLFGIMVRAGQSVPNNWHFDTTRANLETIGASAVDLPIPEARDTARDHPFKGNIDLARLEQLLEQARPGQVPLALLTVTSNGVGGQPVSLDNIAQTRALLARYGVPLFLDACRFAENAWFIHQREPDWSGKPVPEIVHAMFSLVDGFTFSAKKDGLANIGGLLGVRDKAVFERVKQRMVVIEGFPTYGGLSGRDLEAMARGLREVLDPAYLAHRVGQVCWMVEQLDQAGVPVLKPAGGHGVFLDARRFLPHIPQAQFPGQALATALFVETGVRGCEIGSVMFAKRDELTGEMRYPDLDLVRLAIPRRMYTNTQLAWVADGIVELYAQRERIRGMRIVEQAPVLRHFTARFVPA